MFYMLENLLNCPITNIWAWLVNQKLTDWLQAGSAVFMAGVAIKLCIHGENKKYQR
jgi:hypothetical protein